MKRLCLILAYLFLFSQTASAMPLLVGQKVVYRGTVTDLRISAVDGTAFIDNLPLTYSSDFSAGVDGWSATQGTAAGNIDSIGGVDSWLRLTVNNVSTIHGLLKSSVFTAGKKYTLTFKYYVPSGQTAVLGIVPMEQSGSSRLPGATYASGNTTDAVTTYSLTFTAATGTTGLFVAATTGSGVILQDAGGDDVFYIKDIKISEIQPFMDGNHSIEIYDSSNRMLKGVLKAAGTGDTVDSELITSWTNIVSSPYETFTLNANGHDIDSAINDVGGIGWAHSNSVGSAGILSKWEYVRTLASGTAPSLSMSGSPAGGAVDMAPKIAADSQTIYTTLTGVRYLNIYVINVASNFSATNSFKQVLTPSSSGATITTLKNGDVYNWSYKNSSFSFNSASYYVIIRAIR